MNLPDYLTLHAYGEIRLTGHRIGLYHVVDRFREGFSPEMIREEFPTLPLALIYKVIAYYLENKGEVDAYVDAFEAELARREAAHVPSEAAEQVRQRVAAKQAQRSQERQAS